MLEGIPVHNIGQTFQDAIIATRELGLRYLWMDCFCIIQGDAQDWLEESSRIGSIYAYCTVNLVAAAAKTAAEGCFFKRPPNSNIHRPIQIQVCEDSDEETKTEFCCVPPDNREPFRPENCVTAGRGWCFQETFLAPRSPYFFRDELA